MTEKEEKMQTVPHPSRENRYMLCPVCKTNLPVDSVTECSQCGAFLEVHVHYDGRFVQ